MPLEQMDMVDSPSKEQIAILPTWSYATKKTIASGMLNASLLMSNAAQLKSLYDEDDSTRDDFWTADAALIITSIVMQFVAAVLLFVLSILRPTRSHHKTSVTILNNTVMALILLISMVNIVAAGFGIHMAANTKKQFFGDENSNKTS